MCTISAWKHSANAALARVRDLRNLAGRPGSQTARVRVRLIELAASRRKSAPRAPAGGAHFRMLQVPSAEMPISSPISRTVHPSKPGAFHGDLGPLKLGDRVLGGLLRRETL